MDTYLHLFSKENGSLGECLAATHQDQIAEGDKVVTRWMAKGTPQIEFAGIKPVGNPVTITAIHIHRIQGCKLVEHWEAINLHSVKQN